MGLSCASGARWQGFKTRKAKVLYIGPEGFFGLIRRHRAWEQANTEPAVVAYWSISVNFFQRPSVEEAIASIEAQEWRPHFILIDTLHRSPVGADENSVKCM